MAFSVNVGITPNLSINFYHWIHYEQWIMKGAKWTLYNGICFFCFVSGKLSWHEKKNVTRTSFYFIIKRKEKLRNFFVLPIYRCWGRNCLHFCVKMLVIHLQYKFLKGSGKNVYCVLCWIFYQSFFFVFAIIEFCICSKKKNFDRMRHEWCW